jgi:hypothetical protein
MRLAAVGDHQATPEGSSQSKKRSCSNRSSFDLIFGLVFCESRFDLCMLHRLEDQNRTTSTGGNPAHVDWLKNGDWNAILCSETKHREKIAKLKGDDGGWIEGQTSLKLKVYISGLVITGGLVASHATADLEQLLEHVQPRV